MNNLSQEQLNRAIEIGKTLWSAFTQDERDKYFDDTGTISFFENVLYILNLHEYITTLEQLILFEEAISDVEITLVDEL